MSLRQVCLTSKHPWDQAICSQSVPEIRPFMLVCPWDYIISLNVSQRFKSVNQIKSIFIVHRHAKHRNENFFDTLAQEATLKNTNKKTKTIKNYLCLTLTFFPPPPTHPPWLLLQTYPPPPPPHTHTHVTFKTCMHRHAPAYIHTYTHTCTHTHTHFNS